MDARFAHVVFESCPAPTLVVDSEVRVLEANRAARDLLRSPSDEEPLIGRRNGEALRCVHSYGPGGCGRQAECAECVIRNSVQRALTTGAVRRVRTFMRVRNDHGEPTDLCVLVSASALPDGAPPRVLLTLENVSDLQLRDAVIRAEEALLRANDRAASVARFPEENLDPVLRIDGRELRLVYANPAARTALASMCPATGSIVPDALSAPAKKALARAERVRSEVAAGDRTFELSFCPVGSEVNVYGRDITSQKRTMEQLASEKQRLAITLGSIGDAVVATDERGHITVFNAVAEALTGWSAEHCIGKHIDQVFRIISEQTRERAVNPVERALREGVVVGLANHTALVARDGTERPIADSAAPIRDSSGRIVGVVLVFRDQTSERRAEQALRESEQRIRVKLESVLSPDGDLGDLELGDIVDARALHSLLDEFNKLARIPVAVVDVTGKVLVGVGWQDVCTQFHRAHPETCKHCVESDTQLSAGVPPGEIRLYKCKNNMWDVATPITIAGHHLGNVFMGQFFFDDEPIDYELFRCQAAQYGFDERQYLAALEAVPRLSRQAVDAAMAFFLKFAGMLSQASFSNLKLARSVADRERLVSELRDSKERLEADDGRKNEFLAVLSHELRNPLAPIRNSLYILDHAEPGGQQARRAKEVAGRQLAHLTRLVDDLLDVTRIARGKVELRRARLDVGALARRTGEDYRTLLHERGITFDVETPREPVWVDGDETRLSQVVGNLLQNAAKFTPDGGRIQLVVSCDRAQAEIRVHDTGSGIDPHLIGTIFKPFVQGKQSLARTEGGLGLGLALVKGLAELHGGTVEAASGDAAAGAGALFIVRLPLMRRAGRHTDDARRRHEGAAPRRRVLVVDDNRDAAESLADLVAHFGHDAEVAFDGPAAIERAMANPPDIVLCDIGLPSMTGYAVARALRSDQRLKDARLVAISGYAQPEDRDRALEAGFSDHLAKPLDPVKLEQLLSGSERRGV